jgi:hypothetical protein
MSPSRLRVNSTLPAPMNAILVMLFAVLSPGVAAAAARCCHTPGRAKRKDTRPFLSDSLAKRAEMSKCHRESACASSLVARRSAAVSFRWQRKEAA